MHSLIVDDVALIRILLGKFLNQFGSTEIAMDGEEAVRLFSKAMNSNPFDLICMDIMMPRINGIQAVQMIRTMEQEHGIPRSKGIKIIMITTVSDRPTVHSAHNFGCDDYMIKPVDLSIFHKKLVNLKLLETDPASLS